MKAYDMIHKQEVEVDRKGLIDLLLNTISMTWTTIFSPSRPKRWKSTKPWS